MRYLTLVVTAENASRTVRNLLTATLFIGSARISAIKELPDGITLNGRRVRTTEKVKENDILRVAVGDITGHNLAKPLNYPLNFVFEDEDLAVLDKPAGLATQGAPELMEKGETVAGALAYLWGSDTAFHPVNRLDKGTDGLMVIAKSGYIHDRLRTLLHTEDFYRGYLAVTCGAPSPSFGRIELPLAREQSASLKRVVSQDGDYAVTDYETIGVYGKYALVSVKPLTGRTHQIRAHLAAIGCPLAGDWMYGEEAPDLISRPALHSAELSFVHPISGERLSFTSPLPEDMRRLISPSDKH